MFYYNDTEFTTLVSFVLRVKPLQQLVPVEWTCFKRWLQSNFKFKCTIDLPGNIWSDSAVQKRHSSVWNMNSFCTIGKLQLKVLLSFPHCSPIWGAHADMRLIMNFLWAVSWGPRWDDLCTFYSPRITTLMQRKKKKVITQERNAAYILHNVILSSWPRANTIVQSLQSRPRSALPRSSLTIFA